MTDPRRGCVFVGDLSCTDTEIYTWETEVVSCYGTSEAAPIPVVVSAANSYSDFISTAHQEGL